MTSSILVTNARSKQSLAIIRSLSGKGYEVSAAGSSRLSRSFYSKHCSNRILVSDPGEDPRGFISDLNQAIAANDIDILLPVSAADTIAVARYQDELRNVSVPIDEYENIEIAHDKEKTFDHARQHEIPMPETYCPSSKTELREISDELEYPVVIKLRKTAGSEGLRYADSREELFSLYDESGPENISLDFSRPLVQEYVSGDIHDVCVLFDDGELKKALTQKRERMFPASGGGGVVNVTTDEPELIDLAERLLSPLDWDGVAQIEFMVSDERKTPALIEINPKLWGTSELSIAAGMNFAKYLVDIEEGNEIEGGVTDYEVGLHFIWLDSGLLGNVHQSGNLSDSISELWKTYNSKCRTNIDLRDVGPHLVRLPQIGALGIRYLLKNSALLK